MLLDVRDLQTHYAIDNGIVRAIDGVSFQLMEGENLGLVGESGCGKTTTAKSINRILPANAGIVGGQILFKGRDVVPLSETELNALRWNEIAMVTQSAMNSLNPVYRIGNQIVEAIQTHQNKSRHAAMKRAEELFGLVGLEKKRLWDYPHQLSGGMKQRVVIAMALALEPALIIADEPTTALDVVVQDGILSQFVSLQKRIRSSLILVTHDISVVAEICQRVAVMYAGKIMEQGTTAEIFRHAYHPYTLGLLNAFPTLEAAKGDLISIPGSPPNLAQDLEGCRFRFRCPFATPECERDPEAVEVASGHSVLCHYPDRAAEFRQAAVDPAVWEDREPSPRTAVQRKGDVVLSLNGVKRHFGIQTGWLSRMRNKTRSLRALDGISFDVYDREILGFAGESGSGKSTLGEIIARLQIPTEGRILYLGQEANYSSRKELKAFRRQVQVVFQDPYETLNPRFTVLNTVMEPLKIHNIGRDYDERLELVKAALIRSELEPPEQYLDRYPHQLSGGQRQRIALARAIVTQPQFIIADEPVSMLDVSVRAGILNLLRGMRDELGVSIIYISHDLATIRYICDRTAILYLGRIMEMGATETVITEAAHPYTQMLLAAVPRPDPDGQRARVNPRGEIPDPIDLPNGCRFHPRCTQALAHCGWEGRDLRELLEQLRESGTAEEAAVVKEISTMKTQGLALVLTTLSGANGCSAASLQHSLQTLLQKHNPALLAAAVFAAEGAELVVRFPAYPEPELCAVGDNPAHQTACYLYSQAPAADRAAGAD